MNASHDPSPSRAVRKIRIRALVFLTLAVCAGGAAVFLVKIYLDRARQSSAAAAQAVETTPVVVAARDLPIAQVLEESHLAVVHWPSRHVPAGAVSRPEEVLGRSLRQSVVAGEALLDRRLADEGRGRGLAAILEEGTRAMAVKVDQVIGVAGFVRPGDYVDVLTTMKPDEETKKSLQRDVAQISKIILQSVRVLAVGEHLDTDSREPVKVQVVTLEVTPEESERLALASQHGSIQLTMRSRLDQKTRPTLGVDPLSLLAAGEGEPVRLARSEEPPAAADDPTDQQRRARRARRARARDEEISTRPQVPVVEILRGTRNVEERKLRPSADSE